MGDEQLLGRLRVNDYVFRLQEKGNAALKKQGIQNVSKYNFIFKLTDNYMANVAGHVLRHHGIRRLADEVAGKGYGQYGREVTHDDYKLFQEKLTDDESDIIIDPTTKQKIKHPRTFQAISRVAAWLTFKEVEKQHAFKHIVVPEAYLVHVPGRSTEVSDHNYVVVQQFIPDLEDVDTLTPEEELEMLSVLRKVSILDCNPGSLKRRKSDGKLVMLDFEQPGNANPQNFYHKVDSNKLGDIATGYYVEHFVLKYKPLQ